MANYKENINLANLDKVGVVTLNGSNGPVKCVVIPIEPNHIFVGEKGIYLDLVCIESPNSQYGGTHLVKRNITKEEREQERTTGQRMTKILGNLKPIAATQGNGDFAGGETYTQGTTTVQQVQPQPQQMVTAAQMPVDESLPF